MITYENDATRSLKIFLRLIRQTADQLQNKRQLGVSATVKYQYNENTSTSSSQMIGYLEKHFQQRGWPSKSPTWGLKHFVFGRRFRRSQDRGGRKLIKTNSQSWFSSYSYDWVRLYNSRDAENRIFDATSCFRVSTAQQSLSIRHIMVTLLFVISYKFESSFRKVDLVMFTQIGWEMTDFCSFGQSYLFELEFDTHLIRNSLVRKHEGVYYLNPCHCGCHWSFYGRFGQSSYSCVYSLPIAIWVGSSECTDLKFIVMYRRDLR